MKRLIALLFLTSSLAYGAAGDPQPLRPVFQGTKTITCGVASAATDLSALISAFVGDIQLEVQNAGSVPVFVETGSSLVASAVASGYAVMAGQSKVITVGPRITHVACISGSAAQTVYVTVGTGN